MRLKGDEVTLTIGGVPVVLRSISYSDVAKPAPPERVRVSGCYGFEVRLVERPSVVIHDALSDRVEDIVEALSASDAAGQVTVTPYASAEEADAAQGQVRR